MQGESMKVCMLASSSKGNCTLIWDDKSAIMIDCGISLKETENRMEILGADPHSVSAILVTHEHSDHTKGVGMFARKYGTKIYAHADGVDAILEKIGKVNTNLVVEYFSDFAIDNYHIHAFKLPHDSICCVGYTIKENDKQISIMTDLGYTNDDIIKNVFGSRLVILEANYDEKMLRESTKYSFALKNRIGGRFGHLSNKDSADVICKLACAGVKQILLAHLSEENNTPDLCYKSVCDRVASQGVTPGINIMIDIAKAHDISTLFTLK